MSDQPEYQKINEAIVKCLGPALPMLRTVGPSVNREELKAAIGTSFGAEIAAKVMDLYEAGTGMPVDWRGATDESVRADFRRMYERKASWLTDAAKDILIDCASAYGW